MPDDDMILPDDFVDTPAAETMEEQPQDDFLEDTGTEEVQTEGEETTPPDVQTEQEPVTQPQTLKVKYNSEERELTLQEATELAQKGMNYEKAVERAAQQARDAYIAEQKYTWQGKPITTEAEYKQAVREQEIYEKYKDQVPDEVMQEIIESRRDREERQKEKAEAAERSKRDADFAEFFQYFKSSNDRDFDPNKDALPAEVMEAIQNGVSPKFAYMQHENKQLRNQLKIAEQNKTNRAKAPVSSVTSFGGTKTDPTDLFLEGFNSI